MTAALQAFLDEDSVSADEAIWWRDEITRRRARIAAGEANWVDGETYFAALAQRLAALPETVRCPSPKAPTALRGIQRRWEMLIGGVICWLCFSAGEGNTFSKRNLKKVFRGILINYGILCFFKDFVFLFDFLQECPSIL